MTDITIYGPAMSTYVRTARLAAVEKGITHAIEEVDWGSESHRKLHPFAKVPALRHGDFVLYESEAICRYIDRAFPGPPLQPADFKALARMDQWLSAVRDYVYPVMFEEIMWERLVVPMEGGQPDEAMIAAAVPKMRDQLAVLERALAADPYLAGDAPSLADWMLFPIVAYLRITPEGEAALPAVPKLGAWFARIAARPSAPATDPARG